MVDMCQDICKHVWIVCIRAQVKDELATVEQADMNGQPPEDSFARVNYHKDAEYAVNEQIK